MYDTNVENGEYTIEDIKTDIAIIQNIYRYININAKTLFPNYIFDLPSANSAL
jgi:hypothetical protein